MIHDLRQNNHHVALLVNEDGLMDIFLGIGFLGFAIDIALDASIWFISGWMIAYFLILMGGKEVITQPRISYFEVDANKITRLNKVLTRGYQLLIISLVLGVALIIISSYSPLAWSLWLQNSIWLVLAVFIAIGLSLLAYFNLGGKRYYFFSANILVGFLFQHLTNAAPLPYVFLTAALLLISGLGLLARFLIKYPLPTDEGK